MPLTYITPDEVVAELAERLGVSQEQARKFFQVQAELAATYADRGFPIAGIGVLFLEVTPERVMQHKFGPKAGTSVRIPKKTQIKFRLAQPVKDAIFTASPLTLDVFKAEWFENDEEE